MGKYPLPPVFDHRYYASHYPNAANLSFKDACRHFLTIGKKRGYPGSPIAGYFSFIAWIAGLGCEQILEIGPGVSPSFSGDNVFYFDVRNVEEFNTYARRKGIVDTQSLPSIDYYSKDGSLNVINNKFDLIFSSHCIEHVYDIVKHINDVAQILAEDGSYCLVIPDKRYCIDHFRSVSSVGDMIDKHFSTDSKYHRLQVFIDQVFIAHNDPARHWRNDHGETNVYPAAIDTALNNWKNTNGMDHGLHAWTFTDDSFLQNLSLLYSSGITQLKPVRVYNTPKNTFSFCAILQRPSAQ